MVENLKDRQLAAKKVERQMIEFLMQFMPARELRVCDVHQIADAARTYAFEAFSPNVAS